MALPFLRGETEENATQTLAFVSIVIVTLGLAIFNVCGAIAGSQSDNWLEYIIRGAFGLVITGAEFLAAVALVRVMLAKNMLRKVVGTIIFIGLAWVCIQNGKRAAHLIFPEFATSATLLEEQAKIAGTQEDERLEAQERALDAAPALLAKVQNDLAEAQRKQRLLQAESPEKIQQMQQMLISEGYYFFQVDGKTGPETEKAMRSMGEDLRNDISRLEDQEARLMTGLTTVQTQPTEEDENGEAVIALTPAAQQAILADQARQARQAAIWIEIMLWVVEGARSFGLWALVTTITAKQSEEKDPVRSEASKKGWEKRKRKNRQTEKITLQYRAYLPAVRAAKKKMLKNPRYLPSSIAKENFKVSEARMEQILKIMVKHDLITQEDMDTLMRRFPVVTEEQASEMRRNAIDVIDPDPSSLNGSAQIDGEDDDVDHDSDRAAAD